MAFEALPPYRTAERLVPAASPPESVNALLHEVGADDDLVGNRTEWKYVLPASAAAVLREVIGSQLAVEEFVPGRRKTLMHSVYFDSADFMLYRRAFAAGSSLKFRLRTYATHGGDCHEDLEGFFECKIGLSGKKHKLRARVPVLRAGALLLRSLPAPEQTGKLSGAAERRFMRKARKVLSEFAMQARLTVSYVREAWVSPDGRLRVTFDEQYRASAITEGLHSALTPPLGLDAVVVELKFVGELPAWLAEMLAFYGLPAGGVSFSKFRQGVALTFPHVAEALAREMAARTVPLHSQEERHETP